MQISDSNEWSVAATFLGTVDAILALGQRRREANLSDDSDEDQGTNSRIIIGEHEDVGGQTGNVFASEAGSNKRGRKEEVERTVAVAIGYREQQNRLLLRARRSFVREFEGEG